VRAQGNRREIPGELNAGGRCGRKGAELTRGPGASERGGNVCGEGGPAKRARTVREGDAVCGREASGRRQAAAWAVRSWAKRERREGELGCAVAGRAKRDGPVCWGGGRPAG